MIEKNLLKDPVLKQKLAATFDNPIGDIGEEIVEQDLHNQVGGLSPAVISLSAVISTVASAISGAIIKDASANVSNPGRYCTVSAECFAGKSC